MEGVAEEGLGGGERGVGEVTARIPLAESIKAMLANIVSKIQDITLVCIFLVCVGIVILPVTILVR